MYNFERVPRGQDGTFLTPLLISGVLALRMSDFCISTLSMLYAEPLVCMVVY